MAEDSTSKSGIIFILILALVIIASSAYLAVRLTTFGTKTFSHTIKHTLTESQTPDDARFLAVYKAKRGVLEKAARYMEGIPVVKKGGAGKDNVAALAAAVLKVRISGEPQSYAEGYASGIKATAAVDVDSGALEKEIGRLLKDKVLLEKLKRGQKAEQVLFERIGKLEAKDSTLGADASAEQKDNLKKEFRQAVAELIAVELNNKAQALWDHGVCTDAELALKYLEEAANAAPEYIGTYYHIGMVFSSKGENSRALEYYNRALEIELQKKGPVRADLGHCYFNLGAAYGKIGDYPRSLEYYTKALEVYEKTLNPNDKRRRDCQKNVEVLSRRLKR